MIYCDLKIPENFATVIKNGLPIEAKFSGYKNKIYKGKVDGVSSRINAETRVRKGGQPRRWLRQIIK